MHNQAAERQRRYRARQRQRSATPPILFTTDDWQMFIDRRTLPQKAGCEARQMGRVLIKELVDNGLDNGATNVTLIGDSNNVTVTDNGPGLDRATILRVFAVNRPLLSSKLQRLPTRGMLGNGLRVVMGAVAAYRGQITVTSRGRAYTLAVDTVTGATRLSAEQLVTPQPGLSVTLTFPFPTAMFTPEGLAAGRLTIHLAQITEQTYTGPSLPSWYSAESLARLMAAARGIGPAQVIEQVFGVADDTTQATTAWATGFIARQPRRRVQIGFIGAGAFYAHYQKVADHALIDGATIPFCVEAWVNADRAESNDETSSYIHPLLNRSPGLTRINFYADRTGIRLTGCGLDIKVKGRRAIYRITLSVITPYVQIINDGKTPDLRPFAAAIDSAVKQAASRAYRSIDAPENRMSVVDAASRVMRQAYLKASDNGTLPAKARQIMYAARPLILVLTGRTNFSDSYFTQEILPDYVRDNPGETADWDVVYDARGHLTEPHTGRSVPLGTVAVRDYLGLRPGRPGRPQIAADVLYPTNGARHRYRNVLFVEKEGFDELWEAVQLAERYDLAIMSTKGMSVVASRHLLDGLAALVDNIFVLHDFDSAGFIIAGTLGTDSRRYEFDNDLRAQIIDIGLRLTDVEAMGLQAEPVKRPKISPETLFGRGATDAEVEFLLPDDDDAECQRVELNAMTSRQLVDFVEAALEAHGVEKVIPERAVLEQHARHLRQAKLASDLIAARADEIAAQAAAMTLPDDLADQIAERLRAQPVLSWDQVLAGLAAPDPPPTPPTGRFGFRRGN